MAYGIVALVHPDWFYIDFNGLNQHTHTHTQRREIVEIAGETERRKTHTTLHLLY